jgi:hypothetical protein
MNPPPQCVSVAVCMNCVCIYVCVCVYVCVHACHSDTHTRCFYCIQQGNIVRRRPKTFFECSLEGPCFTTVYAARFDNSVVTAPTRHPDQQGDLQLLLAGSDNAGVLGNQTTLDNGMVFRNFTFGKLPDGHFDEGDIGSHRVVCFTVSGHTECKTPPLCITIKVRGTKPRFVAPTPPMRRDTVSDM